MDAIFAQRQFVAEPTHLSPFDRSRGALADLGRALAMTGLATAALIGAYLVFLAPEWSEAMSAWMHHDTFFDADLPNPFESLIILIWRVRNEQP